MPKTISRNKKKAAKQTTVALHQLPETYNQLLDEYVEYLQSQSVNPYEFSIKKRIFGYFNVKGQLDYGTSTHISDFIKTPDALAQELPGAKEILKRLESYDNNTIKALRELNNLNLVRLRKRSIRNQILPGLAFTGSILGLLLDVQDFLSASIKDMIAGLGDINISLTLKLLIISLIAFALLIGYINWMFTSPRIGLVDAFGDILKIAMAHRNTGAGN